MRRAKVTRTGKLRRNNTYVGQSIEEMLRQRTAGNIVEITGTGMEKKGFWTNHKDGVLDETNIRTDKFEVMREGKQIEYDFTKKRDEMVYSKEGEERELGIKETGTKGAETASTDGK